MDDDEPTGNINTELSIQVGGSVAGDIEREGDVDFYAVFLQAGVRYQIDLEGTDTSQGTLRDPFLTGIFNSSGVSVATANDDSGVGINSRIFFTPSVTGTYFIGASSFDNISLDDIGTYTLFIDEAALSDRPDPVELRTVGDSGNGLIDGINFGRAYGNGVDAPNITFSFADRDSTFLAPFNLEVDDEDIDITETAIALTPTAQAIIRTGLAAVEEFANIQFTEVPDEGPDFGILRFFGNTAASGRVIGFAGLPSSSPTASDVAIFEGAIRNDGLLGFVILHELGHALGLTHLEDEEDIFPQAFAGAEFTLLTEQFSSAFFPEATSVSFYPTTYGYADILALRHLYGAPPTPANPDNVYRFDLNAQYWQTIFDTEGTDTIEVFGSNEAVRIDLSPDARYFGGAFIDVGTTVRYFNRGFEIGSRDETVFISPETIIENLKTAGGADALVANAADNRVESGGGNDTVDGAGGNDRLLGEAGNDLLIGGTGGDTLVGGTGDDTAGGGAGSDRFFAGSGDVGADLLVGGAGQDLLAGGAGNDLIVGGNYIGDSFSFGVSDAASAAGSDTLFGGSGDDTLIAANFNDSNGNQAFSTGEATDDDISRNVGFAGTGDDLVFGSAGQDELGGGTGNDTISGGGGADTIYGGRNDENAVGTNDQISSGIGDDVVFASGGNDSIDGGDGGDTLFGGSGNDTIIGGNGADDIFNGAGNDSVDAGAGSDTIRSGTGDDTLTGGGGADTFTFRSGHGNDRITDFNLGSDTLNFASSSGSSPLDSATETTVGGVSGLLITTGGTDTIFLVGLTLANASSVNVTFD